MSELTQEQLYEIEQRNMENYVAINYMLLKQFDGRTRITDMRHGLSSYGVTKVINKGKDFGMVLGRPRVSPNLTSAGKKAVENYERRR